MRRASNILRKKAWCTDGEAALQTNAGWEMVLQSCGRYIATHDEHICVHGVAFQAYHNNTSKLQMGRGGNVEKGRCKQSAFGINV